MKTFLKITVISFLFSCQSAPKQESNSNKFIDTSYNHAEINKSSEQYSLSDNSYDQDNYSNIFVAILKDGLDSVNAIINDSTTFVASKGQLILYFADPHTAFIANGQYGYIPPENLVEIDTPYFKFNFSKRKLVYAKDYELYQSAELKGIDLNEMTKNIERKDTTALFQFFKLKDVVDGASAEEFYELFWVFINLWSDNELSSFIMTLKKTQKSS